LNLYTPYWDPERGVWVDLSYGAGTANVNGKQTSQQVRAELATAQKLPDGYGYFSKVRVAGRGVFASAWPEQGEFFALGGGTLFRGFDLAQRQGNMLWVANTELRWPLFLDKHWNFFDNTAGIRDVWLATFYDVGAVYQERRVVTNVANALGVGLRVDTAIFSFIERATFRFDVAKTVNSDAGWQFWLGMQHPF
jgi:hemolysin activation/secretion protein